MKSSTQSRTQSKPSSKNSSTKKDTAFQCTLQFGQQQQIGLKKVSDSTTIKQTSQFVSSNTKKRTAEEAHIIIDEEDSVQVSPTDSKRQKTNNGKEHVESKQEQSQQNGISKQKQAEEEKESAQQSKNLPPKNLEKLRPPSNNQYNPIDDAPIYKGQPIPFAFIARALAEIEECKGQSSKDVVKEIMANIFRTSILLSQRDLSDLFYFFIVKLAPDYEGLETGVGHEMVLKAVAKACGKSPKQIREAFQKEGDLGIVVQQGKSTQNTIGCFFKKTVAEKKETLTVKHVMEQFRRIGKTSGNNSQAQKEDIIMKLLQQGNNDEAKYIVRWLQKNLKTGAAEKTVISALARAIVYTPPNKQPLINQRKKLGEGPFFQQVNRVEFGINEAICEFPNYGLIIEKLLQYGDDMEALKDNCYIRVGIPVKPMLAKPTKGIREVLTRFENIKFTCEYKYDGFRGQIHFDRAKVGEEVKIYSRNLENMTHTYPDVVDFIKESVKQNIQSFILDSELVAYDPVNGKILNFQVLTQRSRKNVTSEDLKTKIQICAFDLLYLNGQSLLKQNLQERRHQMHTSIQEIKDKLVFAKFKDAEQFEEIEVFLNESIKDSCEGLMVKTLDQHATYEPSKRSLNWLKLKKDYLDTAFGDSLDLVVVGADYGTGKRTGWYGSYLLACYNEDTEQLQTVCKMGTGLSDQAMQEVYNKLKELVVDKPPAMLKYKEKNIDVWFQPKYVWEIKAADLSLSPIYCAALNEVEHGKGIALRFPRFIREREDKTYEQTTSAEQIVGYYKNQANVNLNDDDDFDL